MSDFSHKSSDFDRPVGRQEVSRTQRLDEWLSALAEKRMPLAPALADVLLNWKSQSQFSRDADWVFASPHQAGRLPYRPWGVQQRSLKPAGERAGLRPAIGWHTFRHSYSTLLRHLKVDVKVQQELLRHADIRTTLNVYTQGVSDDLREANGKVVRLLLSGKAVGDALTRTERS